MTNDQWLILTILTATVAMFLWGRWRHDMVAAGALLACALTGLIAPVWAFTGFGHPAVITVACVLVLSRGLQNAGAVDVFARTMLPAKAGRLVSLAALMGLGAFLSGFMNNVGTILGGMTTLIGTPPNLIVSGFRAEAGMGSFSMFDFTPIGLAVALAGVLFIALFGWRLVPSRQQSGIEEFESGAYITEVRVQEGSKSEGMSLREIETELADVDAQIIGVVQKEVKLIAPNPGRRVHAGDIPMIETEAESLTDVLSILGLKLEASVKPEETGKTEPADTSITKDTKKGRGKPPTEAAENAEEAESETDTPTKSGDLLLMQGPPESIAEFAADNACVPLAQRELRIPDKHKIWEASLIMLVAIGGAAFGLLPAAITFAIGVLASMALRTVPPRQVYEAIDWPVIVVAISVPMLLIVWPL
jgi:di/tricarboxylate transporter